MSEDKPPRGQRDPRVVGYNGKKDQCRVDGEVKISGKIEADFAPSLVKEYKTSNGKTDLREDRRFVVEKATLAIVLIVAAFSAVQTRQSIRATGASEAANNLAQTNFRLGQRAWVMVEKIGVSHEFSPTEGTSITFVAKNFGQSPALHFRSKTYLTFSGQACNDITTVRSPYETESAMAPGAVEQWANLSSLGSTLH